MNTTKTFDMIENLGSGVVEAREVTSIFDEDDKLTSCSYHRHMIYKNQDITNFPEEVKKVCLDAWV
jgi:hypothetical protein